VNRPKKQKDLHSELRKKDQQLKAMERKLKEQKGDDKKRRAWAKSMYTC
jgi:hypothetical protein